MSAGAAVFRNLNKDRISQMAYSYVQQCWLLPERSLGLLIIASQVSILPFHKVWPSHKILRSSKKECSNCIKAETTHIYGLLWEFTQHHFCHILMVKAGYRVSPDSKGWEGAGNIFYLSMGGVTKNLQSPLVYHRATYICLLDQCKGNIMGKDLTFQYMIQKELDGKK